MEKPKCKLIGKNGNIFELAAKAAEELKEVEMADEAKEMVNRIFDSQSYKEALQIISEYVEIEWKENSK